MDLPPDGGRAARELLTKMASDYFKAHPHLTRQDIGQYLANHIIQEDKDDPARQAGQALMAICLMNVIGQIVDGVSPRHD
jgi:hypothetical protein